MFETFIIYVNLLPSFFINSYIYRVLSYGATLVQHTSEKNLSHSDDIAQIFRVEISLLPFVFIFSLNNKSE